MTAVAGAAQAQSSVTIYGLIDSGYLSTEQDTASYKASTNATSLSQKEAKGITSSASASSRLGFRGVEDLGGGLKAEFVVETGLNATNSTISTFNNRQSFAGINGGFGTFRIGTQYTAHHTIAAAFSPSVGVNMAGDLNYSQGQSAGLLNTLGLTATSGLTFTAPNASTDNAAALISEMNKFLIAAKLSSTSVLATGAAQATDGSVAPTSGIKVVNAGTALDTTASANARAGLTNAQAVVDTLVAATKTAELNARLARVDGAGYTVRRNNTVSYATPVVNGLQLGLGYNAPTTDKTIGGSETKASSQSISLSYNTGKFAAAVAHSSGKTESNTVTSAVTVNTSITPVTLNTVTLVSNAAPTSTLTVVDQVNAAADAKTTRVEVKGQETMAAASYDLGVAKLGYIYSARKAKDTVSDLLDRKSHSVSATVPLGKVTAWANYGIGDQKVAVVNDYDLKAMQVGARYAFSKRTDVYGIYGQTKMDNKGTGVDLKDTQYAVGVRHQF